MRKKKRRSARRHPKVTMPDNWYGVGSAVINSASNIFGGLVSNKLAAKREAAAREENYKYGEMAANNADTRTRALYKDLYGPEAQMQQIKNAGLSPSMYYGDMAGISGQAGAQGTGAAGVSPTTYGVNPVDMSQILLNNSLARKNNAEANITEKSTDEQIRKFFLENKNGELRNEYMEWENSRKAIELNLLSEYGEQEYESKLSKIAAETKKLLEETRKAHVESNVAEETQQQQVDYIKNQNLQLLADISLKRSQTELAKADVNLTNTQAKELLERISQKWTELGISASNLDFNYEKLDEQVKQWAIENNFKKKDQYIAIAKIFTMWRLGEKKLLVDTLGTVGNAIPK